MEFRNLLIINSLIFLAFAIGFILIPSTLLPIYGVSPESGTVLAIQVYGGLLLAIGLLCWFSRGVADAEVQRAMQLSFMIGYAVNTIVHILGAVSGVINAIGWTAVIIYLLLTSGYAYFFFTMPESQEA